MNDMMDGDMDVTSERKMMGGMKLAMPRARKAKMPMRLKAPTRRFGGVSRRSVTARPRPRTLGR